MLQEWEDFMENSKLRSAKKVKRFLVLLKTNAIFGAGAKPCQWANIFCAHCKCLDLRELIHCSLALSFIHAQSIYKDAAYLTRWHFTYPLHRNK